MQQILSARNILNKCFNIKDINVAQRTVLDGTGSFSQFIISGPKNQNIERLVLAQLASKVTQALIIINSIDEMMHICKQFAVVGVFTTYIHGQLSTDEVKQRVDGFRAKDFRFLFITPDQASKDSVLMSIMDLDNKITVVIVNAEKFAKDHLHYSPVYDLLYLQLNSVQSELTKTRKVSFVFNRVYIGYALSKKQITAIVQKQRIHNVEHFIFNYSPGIVLESICVKNTSAILRECANVCANTRKKCIVIVKDKKQSELFFNEMNKQNKTINVFDYPENNGIEAIKQFDKLKTGIFISNKHSHITETNADTVIICQLPLSVTHLCTLLGATSNLDNVINSCHIIYPEFTAFNQATYELNSKFPTIEDHQEIIDYLKKLDHTKFDKNLVFKMSNEIPMVAKTVFRALENLASMLFLSKQVFFKKGFQANFEVLNLNRTLPPEIDSINVEVSKQLTELVEMLSTHGCKTDLLNKHIGVVSEAKCGKCSVCHHIKAGGHWNNRIPSMINSPINSEGTHNITNERSHEMYRNPYQSLSLSKSTTTYEPAELNDAPIFNNQRVDLGNPLESKLSLIRTKVAERLKIPELTVFSNKTMHELIEKKPKTIRDLNSIKEFYGSQRGQIFGNEIVMVFRDKL